MLRHIMFFIKKLRYLLNLQPFLFAYSLLIHMPRFCSILQTQSLFIGSVVYSVLCKLKLTAAEQ